MAARQAPRLRHPDPPVHRRDRPGDAAANEAARGRKPAAKRPGPAGAEGRDGRGRRSLATGFGSGGALAAAPRRCATRPASRRSVGRTTCGAGGASGRSTWSRRGPQRSLPATGRGIGASRGGCREAPLGVRSPGSHRQGRPPAGSPADLARRSGRAASAGARARSFSTTSSTWRRALSAGSPAAWCAAKSKVPACAARAKTNCAGLPSEPPMRRCRQGEPVLLEPLPASERRIVHLALVDDPPRDHREPGPGSREANPDFADSSAAGRLRARPAGDVSRETVSPAGSRRPRSVDPAHSARALNDHPMSELEL